jgi:hypothetical protein
MTKSASESNCIARRSQVFPASLGGGETGVERRDGRLSVVIGHR